MSGGRFQRSPEARTWQHLYKTPRWQARRKAQFTKQPLCERCLKEGRVTAATVAHHKQAHKGDHALFFDADNLASSCAPCHNSIEQSVEKLGYEKGSDPDGRPKDKKHPWNK